MAAEARAAAAAAVKTWHLDQNFPDNLVSLLYVATTVTYLVHHLSCDLWPQNNLILYVVNMFL